MSDRPPPLFTSDELMGALGGTMTQPFHATGVSIDTRTLVPGDLFVALQTDRGDGHDHVAAALSAGAAGAMVHRQHDMPDAAPLVVVGDTLAGLTALGAYGRQRFTGSVLAITGSVGKTTTKEMLRLILGASGQTHASHASYNNHWGVPLTLARLPPDADYAVIEIGMNHPGEIAPLARLAGPDVALITAIGSAHIGNLGSLAAIAAEKTSIAAGILQGGTLVAPAGTAAPALDHPLQFVTFDPATLEPTREDADGSAFTLTLGGRAIDVALPVPGRHMAANALAALTAAHAIGADAEAGARALAGFAPVDGRGTRRAILDGQAVLLDESYNASVASIRAALAVLALTPARRRIAILGDMLELGDHSEAEHAALAPDVLAGADLLYASGMWMQRLYEALPEARRGAWRADSVSLAPVAAADLRPGDAVLVKGSLGSRMRVVVDALLAAPDRPALRTDAA